ncbi:MAG TPA: Crp/Fnr family transcriptional regulator [Bacteroidia bacterium]
MTNRTCIPENKNSCSQCWLREFSVFKNCPPELMDEVFVNKKVKTFSKGELLISEAAEFKGVFCVQQGVVKIFIGGNDSKEFTLWFARPGDFIGLDSFINNENYTFSAVAVDEVVSCFIPASDFKSILTKGPAISIGLMKDLCDKINFIEDRITSISKRKIREQFAEILLSLSMKNKKIHDGEVHVDFAVKDLANVIGTSKNYLDKIISEFSDLKVVAMRDQKLIIRDFDKLSLIAIGEEAYS